MRRLSDVKLELLVYRLIRNEEGVEICPKLPHPLPSH